MSVAATAALKLLVLVVCSLWITGWKDYNYLLLWFLELLQMSEMNRNIE